MTTYSSVVTQQSAINYTWVPVIAAQVGTNYQYAANNAFTMVIRSNATVAMSDILPNPATAVSDGSENVPLQNGWNFYINNQDASASITLTPTLPATINGTTSITITAGTIKRIFCDGTNYYA